MKQTVSKQLVVDGKSRGMVAEALGARADGRVACHHWCGAFVSGEDFCIKTSQRHQSGCAHEGTRNKNPTEQWLVQKNIALNKRTDEPSLTIIDKRLCGISTALRMVSAPTPDAIDTVSSMLCKGREQAQEDVSVSGSKTGYITARERAYVM